MKTIKKILEALYVLIIVVMATATIIGKYAGNDFADAHIYGSWWFCLLWALGVAAGIAYFVQSRIRRPSVVVLHLSFVVILAGALITHVTAKRGMVHLRQGLATNTYINQDGHEGKLPFTIKLNRFRVDYHAGNAAAMDYESNVTISDGTTKETYNVSMNHIYNGHGTRLYQSSYDPDMQGSYLALNSDPIGIPVTYTGYGLLFFALLWMLIDPRGRFRALLHTDLARRGTVLLLLIASVAGTQAQQTLPRDVADEFGRTFIVYNGRICPTETFAIDFTKKLYGKPSYKGFSPCQVLTGFLFFNRDWMQEPIVKVKGAQIQERLGLPEYTSPAGLFNPEGYVLGPYLAEAQQHNDKFSQQVLDTDEKMMLIVQLERMDLLRMFPFKTRGQCVQWYTPNNQQPTQMPKAQQRYVHDILPMGAQLATQGNYPMVKELFQKLRKYQYTYGEGSIPSHARVEAEHVLNHIPFATILFMVNLTLGIVSVFFLTRRRGYGCFTIFMGLSWLSLTAALALRWTASGTIPMGNGYETMLFLSWIIMLVALLTTRRLRIMTTFGLLMSGFMLLVSHISAMDPAITPRMPVLNSPLLTIHVSIIMMAYALLSLTFITAIAWLCTSESRNRNVMEVNAQLTPLSQIFFFPGMAALGIGIFMGAIWANVSWGSYWGWDPKETWSLITFMIYAAAFHTKTLPALQRPKVYHIFMILAFLSILVTYFGVNYLLPGMHSYA